MTTTTILSPATLAGLRDRVLADAGDSDVTALQALAGLADAELSALYYGYAKAVADEFPRRDLHDRAMSYAHGAAGALGTITAQVCAQVRAELAAALLQVGHPARHRQALPGRNGVAPRSGIPTHIPRKGIHVLMTEPTTARPGGVTATDPPIWPPLWPRRPGRPTSTVPTRRRPGSDTEERRTGLARRARAPSARPVRSSAPNSPDVMTGTPPTGRRSALGYAGAAAVLARPWGGGRRDGRRSPGRRRAAERRRILQARAIIAAPAYVNLEALNAAYREARDHRAARVLHMVEVEMLLLACYAARLQSRADGGRHRSPRHLRVVLSHPSPRRRDRGARRCWCCAPRGPARPAA